MEIRGHRLILGGIPAADLAREFGTPLYVYEEEAIRRQARLLREAVPHRPYRPRYSIKANGNPRIVALILEEGLDLEAVSPGELALAAGAGATPERLHFFSAGMTPEEMRFARSKGASVTVDTLPQLEVFSRACPGSTLSIRLNPGGGAGHHDHVVTGGPRTKFGIPVEQAGKVLEEAKRLSLRISGLHMHVGSNFLDPGPFLDCVEILLKTARDFPDLDTVCVGGGFGIAYQPGERSLDLGPFGRRLGERFGAFCREYGRDLALAVEPGRFLVCEAGFLLATVATLQRGTERCFAVTDTGFNHLVRPAMYGSYHPILKADAADLPASGKVDVCGNLCETGDVFRRDCELPALAVGDVLAITHAGAYGFSMASEYNARPLPSEVLVKDGRARVIRRRETPEDLASRQLSAAGMGAMPARH